MTTTEQKFRSTKASFRLAILDLLSDLQWHSHLELSEIGGNRYGARIDELAKDGYHIERRPIEDGDGGHEYRLTSTTPAERRTRNVRVYAPPDLVRRAIETRLIPEDLLVLLKDSLSRYEANN